MNRVHVIGRKNHGKTTLVVDLINEFLSRGVRVGTIKHTHHHHELDTPGKDSHRHREAGAAVVGILSRSANAVFWPATAADSSEDESNRDQRYESFAPMFAACDLVLVEGDTKTDALKLEVWRSAVGSPPLAASDPSIFALVTDDDTGLDVSCLPRSNVSIIVNKILEMLE